MRRKVFCSKFVHFTQISHEKLFISHETRRRQVSNNHWYRHVSRRDVFFWTNTTDTVLPLRILMTCPIVTVKTYRFRTGTTFNHRELFSNQNLRKHVVFKLEPLKCMALECMSFSNRNHLTWKSMSFSNRNHLTWKSMSFSNRNLRKYIV